MPYADPNHKIAHDRARYQRDGVRIRAVVTQRYHIKRDQILDARKEARKSDEKRARDAAAMRLYHATLRAEMIVAYGGKCQCCGEAQSLFLELDHAENNGHEHRRVIGRGSGATYRHLKNLGWPKAGYQLLCANCNAGKARNGGRCPHHG